MVAWSEYKSIAEQRGALAMEVYVVTSSPAKDANEVKDILPAHLAYQSEQEQLGNLVMAGPLSDETGNEMQGAGLIVYRAPSLDDARRLADADPMHKTGTRSYTIRRWLVNEGSFQVDIKLSTQSVRL